jgi:integrase
MGQVDLEGFESWLRRRGRGRSAEQYVKVVRRWLNAPREVEAQMVSSDDSPNYRRHLIACVRIWAQYTQDGELLLRLADIKRPPAIPLEAREPFELEQWFKIREAIDGADYLDDATRNVCSLIALRGIRCGDVLRLTRREIERAIDTGTLSYEGKGERRQEYNAVPLEPYLKGLLRCRWNGKRVRDLVSPRSAGGEAVQRSAGRQIRRAFDRIADELELPPEDLYAHRFRHTYATYFLQQMAGDPEAIFKLQQQMGWARLDTASNYLRRSRRRELDEIESQLLSGRKSKSNVSK